MRKRRRYQQALWEHYLPTIGRVQQESIQAGSKATSNVGVPEHRTGDLEFWGKILTRAAIVSANRMDGDSVSKGRPKDESSFTGKERRRRDDINR